jgi:hypothetical protein
MVLAPRRPPSPSTSTTIPPGWVDVRVSPTTAAFADSLGMTVNNVFKIARIAEFIPR